MSTPIPKVPHLVGTNQIVILEDIYETIGEICGISKITDTPPDGATTASIRSLVANGTIRRATVRLSNGKIRTVYMAAANCPKVGALQTLAYATGLTIKTAYFSERVTFA